MDKVEIENKPALEENAYHNKADLELHRNMVDKALNYMEDMKKENESKKEPYPPRPKDGEKYYRVDDFTWSKECLWDEEDVYDELMLRVGNCFWGHDRAKDQAECYRLLLNKVWELKEKYGEIKEGDFYMLFSSNEEYETIYFTDSLRNVIDYKIGSVMHYNTTEEERNEVLALLKAVHLKDFSMVDELGLLNK
ncbi:MAG: hypothetical protein GY756_02835 [bacterium]|nr:hypothetical protein [bacterium]